MQCHNLFIKLVVLCSLGLIACGSSTGEPCQVPSDCSSGLLCCKTPGSSVTTRGVCRSTCSLPDASIDATIDATDGSDDDSLDSGPDGSGQD